MKVKDLEPQIIKYCQQRNIPIIKGKVPEEYRNEIMDFAKQQIKRDKKRGEREDDGKITKILKPLTYNLAKKEESER